MQPTKNFQTFSPSSKFQRRCISQLQLVVRALSLVAVQLQGCSESFDAILNDISDAPFLFLATWLGLLGVYLFWAAKLSEGNRKVLSDHSFEQDVQTVDDEMESLDNATDAMNSCEECTEFSPEGLIEWV